jgi:hypothetical protein
MTKYFYNTRVIHKPSEGRFEVQLKKHWWSRWEYVSCRKHYLDKPGFEPLSKERAFELAMQDARDYAQWGEVYNWRKINETN